MNTDFLNILVTCNWVATRCQ